MRRLNYNIYSSINDAEYFAIEERLIKLESAMAKIFRKDGWQLTETVIKNDALIVDFILKNPNFNGNIGIAFDDSPKQQTFSFYVTKSFDEKHKRYFIRADVFQKKEIEYFENNITEFVEIALKQYQLWSRYDIIYSGITVDLND